MRTGPGEQYPVKWVYRRPGLPLEVIAEYHHWRRVRDVQGTEGWMHKSMLSGVRRVVVGASSVLRAEANAAARPIARVDAMVVGTVRRCPGGSAWCQVAIEEQKGWLRRDEIWGVYPGETLD